MMPTGGTLRITAKAERSSVIVRVQDSGPGIPSQIQARLFQPFVSSGKKNGVGLGLAFSHQTVLDHGGKLWADPNTRQGACFLVQLPL
jgi:signal transduction histidine kinase